MKSVWFVLLPVGLVLSVLLVRRLSQKPKGKVRPSQCPRVGQLPGNSLEILASKEKQGYWIEKAVMQKRTATGTADSLGNEHFNARFSFFRTACSDCTTNKHVTDPQTPHPSDG